MVQDEDMDMSGGRMSKGGMDRGPLTTAPKGVYELWDRVVVEWNAIPLETCQRLI
jgi:hypothetical protein